MTQTSAQIRFDPDLYQATLAYYGLPADYMRVFRSVHAKDPVTGEPLYKKNGQPDIYLVACHPKESSLGNALWIQVNQPREGTAFNGKGKPKKAENGEIGTLANITLDYENAPDPRVALEIGDRLNTYLIEQGWAMPGTPVEDSGAGPHHVLPIPPIKIESREEAERWNRAIEAFVEKYIKPEFQRLCASAGIEMEIGSYDISRILSVPGTWRPTNPTKQDCAELQAGYLRRWVPPYTNGNYPVRQECQRLRDALVEMYEKTPESRQQTLQDDRDNGWSLQTWKAWMYEKCEVVADNGDESVDIICPWADEHTTPGDIMRVYYGPPHTVNCFHDHCKGKRAWGDLRAKVDPNYRREQRQEYRLGTPPPSNSNGSRYQASQEEKKSTTGVTAEELCQFDADDSGNGDAMYALFGQDFLWCHERGWLYYNGTCWQLDESDCLVMQAATTMLRRRRHAAVDLGKEAIIKCTKADTSRINGAMSCFKMHVGISINEFDADPDLLNCANGVLDLRTGKLEPHNRAQRFTYCLRVSYDEQADLTEWLTFLHDVFGDDEDKISYLQRATGYSLTGHTREEILFYLFGPSRAGKGTFAETFMALLPDPLSTGVDFNSFTTKREGDVSNFDLAPLKPSRMIFASESNRQQSLNPAKIKSLTGGDTVRCCYKHKNFFSYRPQFKAWLLSNHPVNGDPEDDALWGRVRVIEFPNSFLGREDKALKERLKSPEGLHAVLYWAVQGAIKWYESGLTTPHSVCEITKQQRDDLDYIQQWLEECCDGDGWTPNEEVMANYLAWCNNNNVQHPKGPKGLAQSLQAKGYKTGVVKRVGDKTKKGVEGLHLTTL